MNSYPLPERKLSPYCQGYWDNKNKKFFDSNSLDVINCCMETCKDHIEYCFSQCKEKHGQNPKCYKLCNELIDNCESGCMENSSFGLQNISQCAEKSGCGKYPFFDPTCLENNKENIISCCDKNCIENQSSDCDHNLCPDFYLYITGKKESPLEKIRNSNKNNKPNFSKNKDTSIIYIILISLAVVVIFLILNKMKF